MNNSEPNRRSPLSRRRFLKLAGIAFAATTVDGAWASSSIQVEHHKLALPKWDAPGFKIAQVSDVHLNTPSLRDRAHEAFRLAMKFRPDVLVFTGDFLNKATPECLGYVREVFGELSQANCPCFAVPGNHDYTCENTNGLFHTVADTSVRLLRNEVVEVNGVSIVGVDDAYLGHAEFAVTASPRLSRSTLVLLHEPDYVADLQGQPSLVLSGHSHGGEICLPGGHPLHTPAGAQTYTGGYYPKARSPLYVSRGVGTLGPGRIFCPPEVSLFTLSSREI